MKGKLVATLLKQFTINIAGDINNENDSDSSNDDVKSSMNLLETD